MLISIYRFTSHVYNFRLEIHDKTIIEFSLWFSPLEMYNNKQLLDKVFVTCKIINVSVRVISLYGFLLLKGIIKQLLDSVFVICKIINVSVKVIILAFRSADNSYLDIDNSAYHKNLIQLIIIG